MLAAILGFMGVSSLFVLIRTSGVDGILRFYTNQGEEGLWTYHVPTRAAATLCMLLYLLAVLVAFQDPALFKHTLETVVAVF